MLLVDHTDQESVGICPEKDLDHELGILLGDLSGVWILSCDYMIATYVSAAPAAAVCTEKRVQKNIV